MLKCLFWGTIVGAQYPKGPERELLGELKHFFIWEFITLYILIKKKQPCIKNTLKLREQNTAYFVFQYPSSRNWVGFASWALFWGFWPLQNSKGWDWDSSSLFPCCRRAQCLQQTIQISSLKHLHLGGRFSSSHSSSQSQLIAPNLVFSFRMDFIKPPAYFTAHMLCQLSLHNAKLKAVTYSKIKAASEYSLYWSPFCKLLRWALTIEIR